jgi:hypothetical protein
VKRAATKPATTHNRTDDVMTTSISLKKLCIFIRFLFILIFIPPSVRPFSAARLVRSQRRSPRTLWTENGAAKTAEMILRELPASPYTHTHTQFGPQQNPLVANYANESDAFNSALQRHSQVTSKVTAALLSFSLRRKNRL